MTQHARLGGSLRRPRRLPLPSPPAAVPPRPATRAAHGRLHERRAWRPCRQHIRGAAHSPGGDDHRGESSVTSAEKGGTDRRRRRRHTRHTLPPRRRRRWTRTRRQAAPRRARVPPWRDRRTPCFVFVPPTMCAERRLVGLCLLALLRVLLFLMQFRRRQCARWRRLRGRRRAGCSALSRGRACYRMPAAARAFGDSACLRPARYVWAQGDARRDQAGR